MNMTKIYPDTNAGFDYVKTLPVKGKQKLIDCIEFAINNLSSDEGSPYICDHSLGFYNKLINPLSVWIAMQIDNKHSAVLYAYPSDFTSVCSPGYIRFNASDKMKAYRLHWLKLMKTKVISSMPFFIRDCNGVIVGNPKGYTSHYQADKQANIKGSKAYNAIWNAYHAKLTLGHQDNLVYSIKQG